MSSVDSSFVDDSSSDEEFDLHEEEEIAMLVAMHKRKKPKHGGSVYGRAFIRRERIDAHKRLVRNYFASSLVFPENYFRRRFRMSKDLFFRICNEVKRHNPVFEQRRNCAGLLGHSIEQKVTAALRIMAYGVPADYIDVNLAMAESTSIFYVKQFAIAMVEVFGPQYLQAPNAQETQRLLEMNKARGFPGMVGSVDCMHWKWKNCPKAWHGQFKGRGEDATIILEAIADHETWILACIFWYARFLQRHQHARPVTSLCQLSKWRSTTGDLRSKWSHLQLWVLSCRWDLPEVEYIRQAGCKPEGKKRTCLS